MTEESEEEEMEEADEAQTKSKKKSAQNKAERLGYSWVFPKIGGKHPKWMDYNGTPY